MDADRQALEARQAQAQGDLGFGSVVAAESRRRLINRDGSFNVRRRGLPWRSSFSLFNDLVALSWPAFSLLFPAFYLLINCIFAAGYLALGPAALEGPAGPEWPERALQAFFFSIHTFSTVGYGHIVPANLGANVLMAVEAVVELFLVALATGLVLARFSRPVMKLGYSENAVVAPYESGEAFMFRIANLRKSQILDLTAKVIFSCLVEEDGKTRRRFAELPLERREVTFFPLSWTIVHPIDDKSPFLGLDRASATATDVEVLVLLQGVDDTMSEPVHSRSSYKAEEILWNARFPSIIQQPTADRILSIDIDRLDEVEMLSGPVRNL